MVEYLFFISGFIIGNFIALFISNVMWINHHHNSTKNLINYIYFIAAQLTGILYNEIDYTTCDLYKQVDELHQKIEKFLEELD